MGTEFTLWIHFGNYTVKVSITSITSNIIIEYDEGGIGLIELLDRSNIIALVGGGQKPRFAPNKVMLWDNKASKYVAELEFRSSVLGLRMSTDR